ncbi:MAG: DUF2905 domain-containing protein [Chloroflexi bacterium]|nr:DUF2905 domain-containing protein [Chloroflexota bacterium]
MESLLPLAGVGKLLLLMGGGLLFLGLVLILVGKLPYGGRLPGDIFVQRDGFSLYFPVATFLLLSLFLTIIVNILLRIFPR